MLMIEALTTPLIGPVDLTVPAGDCVGLMGASGAGKSLLLRAIADLDPNTGRVTLDGADRSAMRAPDWRSRVVFVPAEAGWWAPGVGAHFAETPDPAPLLAALGLPDALGWEVERLSSGEKARLALARALQLAPDALLLDEPTAALDPEATEAVEALIAREVARGVAVLLVTHDRAQADRLCGASYRIVAGKLEAVA